MHTIHKKALLSSGGLDSFLLAHEPALAGAVHVFVDVGQTYRDKEHAAAKYVAEKVGADFVAMRALNMRPYEHLETGIIPFRNAELILCAAQHADTIYLGVIADEVNSDKSEQFCEAMEAVLCISHRRQYWTEGRGFAIETPFRETTKSDLVRNYLLRGGSLNSLLKSVSCYDGGEHHCGKCSSCFKRWVALTNALGYDASDAQRFDVHPGMHYGLSYWRAKLESYPPNRLAEVELAYSIARK